ncbi:hypothetical protein AA12717_1605 [Gluconacetobacter sacchari DSM 12717]|uniref:HTH araC/xylS-type domain-containing protein n=1 Tax=Gluconacetobacter sacchari DSM 12717 TaxID=1307940 RepID=A0ABQ0P667_9PROT|nr:helix-turn-helix domain-containing protein [Gluconacetobacter sacchari]GBQ23827.1 hypothetical protein AA12717_1605 [Gluconacetobacter sacchari DSM 12717]
MREMVLHATRWERGASETDPLADSFLRVLALLCGEWLEAADVGYSSLSAFAKAFARIVGKRPARFRQNHLTKREP